MKQINRHYLDITIERPTLGEMYSKLFKAFNDIGCYPESIVADAKAGTITVFYSNTPHTLVMPQALRRVIGYEVEVPITFTLELPEFFNIFYERNN